MKSHEIIRIIKTVLAVSLIMTACQNRGDRDRIRLLETIDTFYKAIEYGDSQTRVALFTDNAIVLPDQGRLIRMDDEVRERWIAYDNEWIFRIKDLERVELSIHDDAAYTINEYYYTFHQKGSDPVWHRTKNMHIWKEQQDGSWKLHADIWNGSPEPAQVQ